MATSPDGLVKFYKLSSGEYQINYGPDAKNKIFVFHWTGLPPQAYPEMSTFINQNIALGSNRTIAF
ncbi:MAG: hypothetical protein R3E39_09745 [Anaerolineae bacterium]